mmetsp:Transcript_4872/g.10772  ORF Transcript_4872/g.10772 Transcript_4872/m.10772 type:complete len:204 (+) Transcript_4872:646-1257(+)
MIFSPRESFGFIPSTVIASEALISSELAPSPGTKLVSSSSSFSRSDSDVVSLLKVSSSTCSSRGSSSDPTPASSIHSELFASLDISFSSSFVPQFSATPSSFRPAGDPNAASTAASVASAASATLTMNDSFDWMILRNSLYPSSFENSLKTPDVLESPAGESSCRNSSRFCPSESNADCNSVSFSELVTWRDCSAGVLDTASF